MHVKWCFCLVAAFLAGIVSGQISNDLDTEGIKKQISEQIPELKNIDPNQIPSMDEVDIVLREKCDKKSGNGTYDRIKENKDKYMECISNFVNVTELKAEVEESKKTGSMDEVFGKYCDKYPELANCTNDLLDEVSPCLEDKEIESINKTISIMLKLKDFMCFKNGDRIAMFVAEGGVECLQSKRDDIQVCLNSTFSSRLPKDGASTIMLPIVLFDAQDCLDFQSFRECVGKSLETCKESTPANLIDAFFKFTKKILPCNASLKNAQEATGFASNTSPALFLLVVSLVTLWLY